MADLLLSGAAIISDCGESSLRAIYARHRRPADNHIGTKPVRWLELG